MYKVFIFFCFFSYSIQGFGQSQIDEVKSNLERTAFKLDVESTVSVDLLGKLDSASLSQLFYIESNGFPVFQIGDNLRAALGARTSLVQRGATLGYRLSGKGYLLGIIDEAGVRLDHMEFTGRVKQMDGVQTSNRHATHVAGTLIAAGVNPQAKGMAFEANLFAYSFTNWPSKVEDAARDGVRLSNHSYGTIAGWRRVDDEWRWYGDPSIDEKEDYKFGFYSSASRFFDDFHYRNPDYLAIVSAGNSRSTSGPTTQSPAHKIFENGNWVESSVIRNPNPSYGSITAQNLSKNILTIGAVNLDDDGVPFMSNFSSWGPTDDGRIKPDVVAVGVGVLSSSNDDINSYATLQGTSMSSPVVAGSLVLVKEHYETSLNKKFGFGSTLKALAIHGAEKPLGTNIGPDYRFGFGMLNIDHSIQIIDKVAENKAYIIEDTLTNGSTNEYLFNNPERLPITVTLVWTDVAGVVPRISLNPRDTMLINDLDVEVLQNESKYFPYILDPSNPAERARTGVNYLDNVEKVFVEDINVQATDFKVIVKHKKNLVNASQFYSLVVTVGDFKRDVEDFYFVGKNDHNWNNPANWSNTNGGEPINRLPTANSIVHFTNDSFNLTLPLKVVIDSLAECGFLNYVSDIKSEFIISDTLVVHGSVNLKAGQIFSGNGVLMLKPNKLIKNGANFNQANFNDVQVFIDGSSNNIWEFDSGFSAEDLVLNGGDIFFNTANYSIENITINNVHNLHLNNASINGLKSISAVTNSPNIRGSGSSILFSETETDLRISRLGLLEIGKIEVLNPSSNLLIDANLDARSLISSGAQIEISKSGSIDSLFLSNSSTLNLLNTLELDLKFASFNSTENQPIKLISEGVEGNSLMRIASGIKLCFDYLNVENIDLISAQPISAGLNSVITNSNGWLQIDCDDILFPDFEIEGTCAGGYVFFNNLSSGNEIEGFRWDFGDGTGSSELESPSYVYRNSGTYTVVLTLITEGDNINFSKEITITDGTLIDIFLFNDNGVLTTTREGESYQWFLDDSPIEGATDKFHRPLENGVYRLAIFQDGCGNLSNSFVVSNIVTSLRKEYDTFLKIFPNPTNGNIFFSFPEQVINEIQFVSNSGEVVANFSGLFENEHFVDVHWLKSGFYIVRLRYVDGTTIRRKVIKFN